MQERGLRHVPDAWIDAQKTVKGYEISFTKYFYRDQPLRELDAIAADLLNLEGETEGLLHRILQPGRAT
jgi:type I restriction enzyme M protein